ncbi:MAG: hypothetical protein QOJ09_2396, partial [Actinomycetota bacterium]|nr:hypothetical protein [Actinomycetota bacterium]
APPAAPPPAPAAVADDAPEPPPAAPTASKRRIPRRAAAAAAALLLLAGGAFVYRRTHHPTDTYTHSTAVLVAPSAGSGRTTDEPIGASLTADQAKQTLATVLKAENAYFESHKKYTEDHDGNEVLTGVNVPDVVTDWGTYVNHPGVVYFWVGSDSKDQIHGALYLGIQDGTKTCFYSRSKSPTDVRTAEDRECPLQYSAHFDGPQWPIPAA